MKQQEFTSNRNIKLITQEVNDKPMLTVENYMKWYDIFVIQINGEVVPVNEITYLKDIEDHAGRTWYDHCPTPAYFHEVSKRIGAEYDNETFSAVCVRFVEDILDDDWTKLADYMPQREEPKRNGIGC